MVRLSIIIPYYKTFEETSELIEVLTPQLTDEVEVFIIDDGCHEDRLNDLIFQQDIEKWKCFHIWHMLENSGGASKPRNIGLNSAKGQYITFIDSDDLISDDYIRRILKMTYLQKDIIYLSWKSKKHNVIMTDKPPKWNCAVWCRVYKRELIDNVRFNEDLKVAEDWVFNEQLKPKSSCCIRKTIYFYNNNRPGSLTSGG